MSLRKPGLLDKVIALADTALAVRQEDHHVNRRSSPAEGIGEFALMTNERVDVAGMMRVNHTGEVCAQALYLGQAAVAQDDRTRQLLLDAASEELDHLRWCRMRLDELEARPSVLDPLWYAGSFAIGVGAAFFGDRVSLGFVAETERQVEAHLGDHLERLPTVDQRSRAIVATMQREEAEHGEEARRHGGVELPEPIRRLMALSAAVMKATAYRI